MTDPRGVCMRRAEALTPGIPYVRGWAEGRRGAAALAAELTRAGLTSDFPGLAADVNVRGQGVVRLGQIRPTAVLELARLLAAGLAAEMASSPPDTASHSPSPQSQPGPHTDPQDTTSCLLRP